MRSFARLTNAILTVTVLCFPLVTARATETSSVDVRQVLVPGENTAAECDPSPKAPDLVCYIFPQYGLLMQGCTRLRQTYNVEKLVSFALDLKKNGLCSDIIFEGNPNTYRTNRGC